MVARCGARWDTMGVSFWGSPERPERMKLLDLINGNGWDMNGDIYICNYIIIIYIYIYIYKYPTRSKIGWCTLIFHDNKYWGMVKHFPSRSCIFLSWSIPSWFHVLSQLHSMCHGQKLDSLWAQASTQRGGEVAPLPMSFPHNPLQHRPSAHVTTVLLVSFRTCG